MHRQAPAVEAVGRGQQFPLPGLGQEAVGGQEGLGVNLGDA